MCRLMWFFFFFQAEDGIRDRDVTGVQTCALPILGDHMRPLELLQAIGVENQAVLVVLPEMPKKHLGFSLSAPSIGFRLVQPPLPSAHLNHRRDITLPVPW